MFQALTPGAFNTGSKPFQPAPPYLGAVLVSLGLPIAVRDEVAVRPRHRLAAVAAALKREVHDAAVGGALGVAAQVEIESKV